MKITTKAYAKINWSLAVCGERPNGYHELDMLMQRISLCDELTFEEARWLTLRANKRYIPTDDRNLVIRAAKALNSALGLHKGASITLNKHIPSRAGLGGGSADCAAALIALNDLWRLHLPLNTLEQIGLTLGADVPFCLRGGLARARGVGEILDPIVGAPEYAMVMITPGDGLSTPEVFKKWNTMGIPMRPIDNDALTTALCSGDLAAAQALSRNDLEPPALELMPGIGRIMEFMRGEGAGYVRMSGSGSTVYGVFGSDERAKEVAEKLPGSIVVRTLA